jgi:hypothetical protein
MHISTSEFFRPQNVKVPPGLLCLQSSKNVVQEKLPTISETSTFSYTLEIKCMKPIQHCDSAHFLEGTNEFLDTARQVLLAVLTPVTMKMAVSGL